jgi:hypothetical protein
MSADFRALCAELLDKYDLGWRARERIKAALAAEPEPSADGEVAEVAEFLDALAAAPILTAPYVAQIHRAATLLQQQAAPAPVPVPVAADVRYEFSVLDGDHCEQAGDSAPTLDDAIREGQHYLSQYNRAWDPHRLELRRVETIPLPQAGEEG